MALDSADLSQLDETLGLLLQRIQPEARRRLAQDIARQLRRSQQARIAAQQNPDGSPYAPRKSSEKRGRVKKRSQRMFRRIAAARFLKTTATDSVAAVQFAGRVARIARVHQEGLEDSVSPGGPRARYEQRRLLGFSQADLQIIRDTVLQHLAG